MKSYKTIGKEANIENVIDKSRFIGYVKPVKTQEEGQAFVNEIRKKHKDATHNVPAIAIGENFQFQWASDDGEPQGTSGPPIIQMLVQEGITDVAVVITRYFGGVKLGTGGLVRAYTSTAKLAIEEAGIVQYKPMLLATVKLPYTMQGKMEGILRKTEVTVEKMTYLEDITAEIILDDHEEDIFFSALEAFPDIVVAEKTTVYRGKEVSL